MMDDTLRVMSMNCRGIGNSNKRRDVFHYLRGLNYSIYMLQDTHFSPACEHMIKNEWGFDSYFSSFSSNSRGVAILFKNDVEYKLIDCVKSLDGNFLILTVKMFDKIFVLVNVYGPNNDCPDFFVQLEDFIERVESPDNIIIGGDWNLVRNFENDCYNYCRQNNVNASNQVNELCQNFNLIDVWREKNPDVRRFTWRRPTPLQQSRLDFFLVNDLLAVHLKEADILPGYRTDHSITTLIFQFGEEQKGKSFWKFNCSLLTDKSYLNEINKLISDTIKEFAATPYNRENLDDIDFNDLGLMIGDQLFLDFLLLKIREKTIAFSSFKKQTLNKDEMNIRNIIEQLEKQDSVDDYIKELIKNANEELVKIREHRMKGVVLRSRARWVENGEKVTSYFCSLEKRNFVNKCINRLILKNGETTCDNNCIINEVKDFYKKLYTKRDVDNIDISNLVNNLPKMDDRTADQLEGELTLEEISEALKDMKNNKSPGSDGFPSEFFKVFWRQLGPFVLRSLNEGFRSGELSNTQKEGVIICIPKSESNRELIKNWRPITLLNIVYKIASASIANRIKAIPLTSLISEDQTGFIKNRYIGSNIRLIYDIINHLTSSNSPGLLLCLDFEKAFDSVDWNFLFKVLVAFGFKTDICRWIKLFLNDIKSTLSINGSISEWFRVSRGCRQGDPISPYLFILCVEIMAIMIRENNLIKGITVNGILSKITQFADDSEILLEGDRVSFEETFQTIERFGSSSGLKLNVHKTNAIWLGSERNSNVRYLPHLNIKWNPETFKILGITFTNDLKDCIDINFKDKFYEMKTLFKAWLRRQITPLGRVAILKSLILSKLVYLWLLLPNPPDSIIDDIQDAVYRFIWNRKPDRINRKASTCNTDLGGIGIPNIKAYVNALKLTWVKKIHCSDHKWKHTFISSYPILENIKKLGYSLPISLMCNNPFWVHVFNAYEMFGKKIVIEKKDDFLSEPIFFNSNFTINNKPFYYRDWAQAGIFSVKDLLEDDGSFLTLQNFKDKYNIQENNFLKFIGCINTIMKYCRKINITLDENISSSENSLVFQKLFLPIKGSRLYYDILNNVNTNHKFCAKWDEKLGIQHNWKNIFLAIHKIKDIKFKWFQIRIVTRILGTNSALYHMNIKDSYLCSFCSLQRESLEHLFYDCIIVSNFWDELKNLLSNNNCVRRDFSIDVNVALFGHCKDSDSNEICYYVLLAARFYIYRCRCSGQLPSLLSFVNYLSNLYNVLRYISLKNQNIEKFDRDWQIWKCIITE